jgi:hypothetical protein
MIASRQAALRPLLVGVVVGFIVGCLLGWLVMGWVIWPASYEFTPESKRQYMRMVADSYSLRRDADLARKQLAMESISLEEAQSLIAQLVAQYEASGPSVEGQQLRELSAALGGVVLPAITPPTPSAGTPAPPAGVTAVPTAVGVAIPAAGPSIVQRALPFCLGGLVLVVIGALVVLIVARRPRGVGAAPRPGRAAAPAWTGAGPPPLSQWVSTFNLGMDNFDESFSIETPTGEFLGECGMGISESLGSETPRHVTAFEVWLFDKSDIRTVTKVLMSEYAYYDDTLRDKLAPKGEPILAEPGATFTLETTSLQVSAEVVEITYGEGMGPANSYFTRLKVSLAAHAREEAAKEAVPLS